jgi:hypothetical protein
MASKKPLAGRKRKAPPASSIFISTAKKRKNALTYTQAVGDIRNMFLEQAALWKDQADRLAKASGINIAGNGDGEDAGQQEPWSCLVDEKGRPKPVFEQDKVAAGSNDDESREEVELIKKKLKRTRQWRYERPMEDEQEEAEQAEAKEDSDEESESDAYGKF